MIYKTFIFIVVVSIYFKRGTSLKCYVCAGTKSSDCAKGEVSSMVTQVCPNSESTREDVLWHQINKFNDNEILYDVRSQFVQVCLRFVLDGFEPDLVSRTCGEVPPNVDPCKFLRIPQVKECKSCNTDLCNHQAADEYSDPPIVSMLGI